MDEIVAAIAADPIGIMLKEQGKEEGIEEGQAQAMARAVTIAWQHRFGTMAPDVQAAISQKTVAELEAVLGLIVGNTAEADARKALGL